MRRIAHLCKFVPAVVMALAAVVASPVNASADPEAAPASESTVERKPEPAPEPKPRDKKIDLGLSIGARIFSENAQLGAFEPAVPGLSPTAVMIPRVTWRVLKSLWLEGELPLAPTTTKDFDTRVFWFAPRLLATWSAGSDSLRALVTVGADMPVALTSAPGIFGTDLSVSGVMGLGVAWSRERLTFRLDGRHMLTLAREPDFATSEWEFMFGASYKLVKHPPKRPVAVVMIDTDGDGIADEDDKCPSRPEDKDGYEDSDGCPDNDDDLDGVLDYADKCKSIAESINGFEDEDGCPDTLPSEYELILGPIEGLVFKAGSDDVGGNTRRLDAIAAVMKKHPGGRIRLIGYISEGEVKDGEDGPNIKGADALGKARAEAVKAELEVRGISGSRIRLDSRGGEQASGDAPTTGRQVELQMDGE